MKDAVSLVGILALWAFLVGTLYFQCASPMFEVISSTDVMVIE